MTISGKSKYTRSLSGDVCNILILLVLAAFMSLPLVYTISAAFKPANELFVFPPTLLVKNPTWANFSGLESIMRDSWIPLSRYFVNSVLITAVGVFGQVIFATLAAYVLSKETFPGKGLLNSVVVLSLMFSATVTSIPNYIIITKLGLINNQWAIILPAFSAPLGLFLMKQFMDQMFPVSLQEAARIDGAGELTIILRIAMPICRPAWLTLIIFSFQSMWNNTGGIYIFSEQLKTLPYALQNIVQGGGIARAGVSAAVALLLVLPPMMIFVLAQSNILETMATSGMKD